MSVSNHENGVDNQSLKNNTSVSRRSVLQAGAAIAFGAPALVGFAQQTFVLKFHTFNQANSGIWQHMNVKWMDMVEKDSGGRIKFERFAAMTAGGTPASLMKQVQDGAADIVWTVPAYTAEDFSISQVFEIPFMMNDVGGTSRAMWEFIHKNARSEWQDKGVRPLALHAAGGGVIHSRERLVRHPDDLRGLRVRAPSQLVARLLQVLGATTVQMPLNAITKAMENKEIDAAVVPWEVVKVLNLHQLTKYHTEFDPAGGALYTSLFSLAMNQKKYESMPPDLQKIIDKYSGLSYSSWHGQTQALGDDEGRKVSLAAKGEIYQVPLTDSQMFRRRARVVEVEWVNQVNKKGLKGEQLLKQARETVDKYAYSSKEVQAFIPKPNPDMLGVQQASTATPAASAGAPQAPVKK